MAEYGSSPTQYVEDAYSGNKFITVLYTGGSKAQAAAQALAASNGYRAIFFTPSFLSLLGSVTGLSQETIIGAVSTNLARQASFAYVVVDSSNPLGYYFITYELPILKAAGTAIQYIYI